MAGKTHFKKGASWTSQRTIVPKEERTSPDGIVHRSRAEMKRWNHLLLLQGEGHIRNLKREVRFKIERFIENPDVLKPPIHLALKIMGSDRVRTYTADFVYQRRHHAKPPGNAIVQEEDGIFWAMVIEDVKGFMTPEQQIRMEVFEMLYGCTLFINKV